MISKSCQKFKIQNSRASAGGDPWAPRGTMLSVFFFTENKPFEQFCEPTSIILWFKTNETFLNRFNQIVIKPIALTLRSSDKSVTLTHQTLLNAFNNMQPLVSFSKNQKRSVSKAKNGELPYLSIDMIKKELDGKEYYPSQINFIFCSLHCQKHSYCELKKYLDI